jgi:hypothetical protein
MLAGTELYSTTTSTDEAVSGVGRQAGCLRHRVLH